MLMDMEEAMEENEELANKLEELRTEHRDMDDVIARINLEVPFDQIQLQRLKKRKLVLKDQIIAMENSILPDIIA
jgi:hypothetical protein